MLMNLQELTALRMQKLYEFGEIEFERKLLKDQLEHLNSLYTNLADEIVEIESQINLQQNNSDQTQEKNSEKLV